MHAAALRHVGPSQSHSGYPLKAAEAATLLKRSRSGSGHCLNGRRPREPYVCCLGFQTEESKDASAKALSWCHHSDSPISFPHSSCLLRR